MKYLTDSRSLFLNLKSVRASKVAMVVVVALIVGIPFSVSAHEEQDDRASAKLRNLDGSGGGSGGNGEANFRDDGAGISIEAEAEGLDTGIPYRSLLYDIDSVATGSLACEPAFGVAGPTEEHPAGLTLAQMGAGLLNWVVDHDGKGQLSGTVPDVNLDRVRTMSIRDPRVPGPFGDGTGPAAVVACGLIVADD